MLEFLLKLLDAVLVPFVYLAALLMKFIRLAGVHRLPISKQVLLSVGVFPIRDHYYEPLFDGNQLRRPLSDDRNLPGIDWSIAGQLALLKHFSYNDELLAIPREQTSRRGLYVNNETFGSGDAEYWYSIIRLKKPSRIIEIGSGNSTLVARAAIRKNEYEDPQYRCLHICIEPFEQPWLESLGITVLREKVENVQAAFFAELHENDILFIDSSHVIRPQGDVLYEYLEILPSLRTGVIVHIHDIFSPRDYPDSWVRERVRFWNEQYLLEAFLTSNVSWTIIGALNYLHHNHYDQLKAKCPHLTHDREPGSFYLQKII